MNEVINEKNEEKKDEEFCLSMFIGILAGCILVLLIVIFATHVDIV